MQNQLFRMLTSVWLGWCLDAQNSKSGKIQESKFLGKDADSKNFWVHENLFLIVHYGKRNLAVGVAHPRRTSKN